MESKPPKLSRSEAARKRNKSLGLRPSRTSQSATLNCQLFDAFMNTLKLKSNHDIAAHLGVGVGTIYSARNQGEPIGLALTLALGKAIDGARWAKAEGASRFNLQDFLVHGEDKAAA